MCVYIFVFPVSKSKHALPVILVLLNWNVYLLKHMGAGMFLLDGGKKKRVLLGGCFVLLFAPKSRQCHRHLLMKMKNEL